MKENLRLKKQLGFNEYQDLASRTANEELNGPQAMCNYSMGAAGEAGEALDMIKKIVFHDHELNRHELAKELGDQLWYISQLARLINFSLEDIATMNVNKLKARYPEGFSSERSVNRES
ncbi:nucleoside triphosphate pyrophosphohydrolase family protein [Cytobacillus sp. IB215665]|uniref:nucleoside triphosphate pyrophosphohydrolase family protein n=1 Tax=Cytobacillus sp. IB215665 TaxID=3097357 RepID=UPI002A125D07|nr:nucleoside triphosphate pyrophosphohydrolase family protein [Cytobacillus sp. IB215665]MDX8367887.1 nucleoside triphosphate pyrophosphohydrolase family protein [Cytobacillus sp. IB215665]